MTPEQLEHAKQLANKIAQSKKHLDFMIKVEEENKEALPDSFAIKYMSSLYKSAGKIEFVTPWIGDEELRKKAGQILKASTAQLIEIYKQDITNMENELAAL